MGNDKGENPLPENAAVKSENVKTIVKKDQIREGVF